MTTYITDKDGKSIDASTVSSMPSNRHFRNAWTLSGDVISEDLVVAKTIFKNKIRDVRKPLLEAQDVLYMMALETNNSTQKSTIKTKKKELRDAPAASAIANADTITKLKAAWNTSLLGTSPYA